MKEHKFKNPLVAEKFDAYPPKFKKKLLFLRQLIFDTAAKTPGVGKLEETLKWGEPSYLASRSKSGTTVRIDWKPSKPTQYAIYFSCKTTLVENFKNLYGDVFKFEGNRSIFFTEEDNLPVEKLSHCIEMALTYHKKRI